MTQKKSPNLVFSSLDDPATSGLGSLVTEDLRHQTQPLHKLVQQKLTEAILSGSLAPGYVLPAELELAQSYGISVGTLRKALLALAEEGLITRRRKTGTVVTGRAPHLTLRFMVKYFRLHSLDGRLTTGTSRSLAIRLGSADEETAEALQIESGTSLTHFHRLRLVKGVPVMLDHYTVETGRLLLDKLPDTVPDQLYLHLEQVHGLRLSAVREALGATLDPAAAAELSLSAAAPLLRIDEVAFDDNGKPLVLALHYANTTSHRYINEIR